MRGGNINPSSSLCAITSAPTSLVDTPHDVAHTYSILLSLSANCTSNAFAKFDNDDTTRPGWKFAEYELRDVPVRIALGARDIENAQAEVARRDIKEKQSYPLEGLSGKIAGLLEEIQNNMYQKALSYREEHTTKVDSWDEFVKVLDEKGGFVSAHWDGTSETEDKIKELTKATIRCIPLNNEEEEGKCVLTGNPSTQRVLFARAY